MNRNDIEPILVFSAALIFSAGIVYGLFTYVFPVMYSTAILYVDKSRLDAGLNILGIIAVIFYIGMFVIVYCFPCCPGRTGVKK